jgi:hypothetical protein
LVAEPGDEHVGRRPRTRRFECDPPPVGRQARVRDRSLRALQELRQEIDDRLRSDLGGRYDRHSARSVGTDKLTVTFTLRASTDADAIRSAGLAAGTLAELQKKWFGFTMDLPDVPTLMK